MPTTPFLSELPEAEAPPDIAAVYADIKRLSGVPMVALIFRHLATHEGVLQEVWRAIAPLFEQGAVQTRAWEAAATHTPQGLMPAVRPAARTALGLDDAALAALRATFEAYNRANPVNLLTMLCLSARLRSGRQEPDHAAARSGGWSPPAPIATPLPAMTPPERMPAALQELLLELTSARSQARTVIPSLYRHLTRWPAVLALLNVILAPRFADGSIDAAAGALRDELAGEAERLASRMPPLERLAAHPRTCETVERFSSALIPQMVIVGHALSTAFAE